MSEELPKLRIEQSGYLFRVVDLSTGEISPIFHSKKQCKGWAERKHGKLPWKDVDGDNIHWIPVVDPSSSNGPLIKIGFRDTRKVRRRPTTKAIRTQNVDPCVGYLELESLLEFFSEPDNWTIDFKSKSLLVHRFGFESQPLTYKELSRRFLGSKHGQTARDKISKSLSCLFRKWKRRSQLGRL